MLLFGHIGITLGIAVLLANALPSSRFSKTTGNEAIESHPSSSQVATTLSNLPSYKASWLASLGSRIDIRLLLIGSLLPDIIDKPVGHFFFQNTISNGRIICPTLLFLALITLAGLYLYQSRGKTSLLAVSFGTFTHLIFDQMWRAPRTLFWPIYGVTFDRMNLRFISQNWWEQRYSSGLHWHWCVNRKSSISSSVGGCSNFVGTRFSCLRYLIF